MISGPGQLLLLIASRDTVINPSQLEDVGGKAT